MFFFFFFGGGGAGGIEGLGLRLFLVVFYCGI